MKHTLLLFTSFISLVASAQTMQGTIKAGTTPRTIDVYLKPSASFSQKDEAMTFALAVPATVQPAPSMGSSGVTANTTGPVTGITGLQPNFLFNALGSTSREVVVTTQTVNSVSYYIYTFIFSGTAAANHVWATGSEQLIFSIQFNGCTSNCSPSQYLMVSLANGGSGGNTYWYFQPNTLGDITNYPAPFYASAHTTTLVNGGSSDGSALSYVALATPFSYYPKTTATDLSQTSNWTSDVNGGAGSSPVDFTNTNQLFNINNNVSNPVVAGTWTLAGSNVILNNTNPLVFTSAARLNVNTGSTVDFNSKNVIFRSDATGTASIGPTTGTLSNASNVTAERYTSNRRAWRLLGIPFSTSSQSIKASWMEGAANVSSNPVPGYGTHITTFTGDPNAANFDAQKPASSIRIYNANTFNSDAAHTPNTTNLITSNPAYFLFVRGDRSVDRTTGGAPTSSTTLRINGTIKQGSLTDVGVPGTNFSLIQNPYLANLDFDAIKAVSGNTTISTFYVWDASLGTVGQYRTVQITGSAPNYTYTATPGSANNSWRFIESGTAFFVPGNNTLVNFTEATKMGGTPPSSMLRTAAGVETEMVINLYNIHPDNTSTLADGVKEVFDNKYALAIDNADAKKIAGFEMNLGILTHDETLAVEKRPLPGNEDIIALKLWNAAPGNYQFEIQPANFSSTTLLAYVKDNYLGIYTPVSLSADTKINFTINADAASAAPNRFGIVFLKNAAVASQKGIVIYPNPVTNGNVTLRFNDQPKGNYTVKIINALGQTVISRRIEHAGGSNIQTINVNSIKGIYLLEVVKPGNSKQSEKVIIN